jgi:uncharacterized membrane-anchored protein YjiN (DUF445 family)
MNQQAVMDALVDLLAAQARREQPQTMMEQMFAKLERLDRPTMVDKLVGTLGTLDSKARGEALDEMVKAAPRKSNVRDTLCSTAFRYRIYALDNR